MYNKFLSNLLEDKYEHVSVYGAEVMVSRMEKRFRDFEWRHITLLDCRPSKVNIL